METRGALCLWDDADGLTAYITTQRPHIDRLALSDILDIPAEKVRVIAPRDQGGGFGVKAPFYREPIIVAYMAQKLGRPMRWIESRQEHLMAVSQERDQIHDLEVAATKDGQHPGAARSRHRRLRRRLRGRVLGLSDAVPRRRRAAERVRHGRWAT